MKSNSYDEWWLRKDMENMGYIFEYCDKYCFEKCKTHVNVEKLLTEFMRSNIRREMETGSPQLLSQSGRDTITKFIEIDLDGDIDKFRADTAKKYNFHQMYWVGWMYAYIHFKEDILSGNLIKVLPIKRMLKDYYLGHEMSKENYLEHIREDIRTL